MYQTDAFGLCIGRPIRLVGLAFEGNRTPVCLVDSSDDFHQRRFSSTVLTHQCMDFAGADLQ